MQERSQSIYREEPKNQVTCKSTYIQSDDEVDRFSLYICRNLVLTLHNGQHQLIQRELKTASDCLSYRIYVKSIERIGDHASGIAEKCLQLKERPASDIAETVINEAIIEIKESEKGGGDQTYE